MIVRLCQILINFIPVFVVYPFYYISPNIFYDLYMNEVRKGIERSGSVLVKLAQYMSHRPDLIDKRTVEKLKHLRD
jgi:predicted unusual protein kinase regulating ubiquinone biosynthesis (AarF/ABC1/UbiB family)